MKSSSFMTRIGVLGGTFDPPHNGHLAIAQEALTRFRLSKILFAPSRLPPHKIDNTISPIEHRVEMVRLAIAGHSGFEFSKVDAERDGPTYTVDTIRLLKKKFGDSTEFYFIMGLDSLAGILTWHKPEELIRLCRLAVFNRSGFETNMDDLERRLPGVRERTIFLSDFDLEISASDLQRRVRTGESIAPFVPLAVAAYIEKNQLYRKSTLKSERLGT